MDPLWMELAWQMGIRALALAFCMGAIEMLFKAAEEADIEVVSPKARGYVANAMWFVFAIVHWPVTPFGPL